jgi:hypothetical protein
MAHFAVDFSSEHFGVYVQGLARVEPSDRVGEAVADSYSGYGFAEELTDEFGLVEAFVEYKTKVRQRDRLRLRAGQFFLPTSRENVDTMWSSPYTLTWSAINSWIAEEVRPIGVGFDYDMAWGQRDTWTIGGAYFTGNDTSGTLLAWRGWAMHDRLSVYDEVVPLPPLDVLMPGGSFWMQRNDGTKPFGSDLDDETGQAVYLRYERPQSTVAQWTRYENKGDRTVYHSGPAGSGPGYEYAWETEFDLYALELHLSPSFVVLGELMDGTTGMGFMGGPWIQVSYESYYLLASYQKGNFRLSGRFDVFETHDVDGYSGMKESEDGEAWTVALMWDATDALRFAVEAVEVSGERPGVHYSGLETSLDASAVSLELRYYFDFPRQ